MKNGIIEEMYYDLFSNRLRVPAESDELHGKIAEIVGEERAVLIDEYIGQLISLASRDGFYVGLKVGVDLQKELSAL